MPILADDETALLQHFASRLAASHRELASRWLERLRGVLSIDANDVFPSSQLLDHIPDLMLEIAGYLSAPEEQEIASNTSVMAKAAELGLMRFEQQASVHQVLREYQLFGEMLDEFFRIEIAELGGNVNGQALALAMSRAHLAVRVLEQQTIDALVRRYTDAIDRQNSRLHSFSRMVSHEIRQPLDVLQLLAATMRVPSDEATLLRVKDMLARNVSRLGELSNKLETLARLSRKQDNANEQQLTMTTLARDVASQLAEMADARGVTVVIADDLPVMTLDAGRVELVLINLIANAIKYSDPDKPQRVVQIERDPLTVSPTIIVRDNGIGVPAAKLPIIFQEFVRVHEHRDEELGAQGMGLGLSIVRECMDAMDGVVTVESQEGVGTTFFLSWPVSARQPIFPDSAPPSKSER